MTKPCPRCDSTETKIRPVPGYHSQVRCAICEFFIEHLPPELDPNPPKKGRKKNAKPAG